MARAVGISHPNFLRAAMTETLPLFGAFQRANAHFSHSRVGRGRAWSARSGRARKLEVAQRGFEDEYSTSEHSGASY